MVSVSLIAIGILILGFVVVYQFGRKNAIDFLASNYELSPEKLKRLKGIQITALTAELRALESRGAIDEIQERVKLFNDASIHLLTRRQF